MRHFLIFLGLLFWAGASLAQTTMPVVKISGRVTQTTDGKALAGVTIVARPGKLATTSSASGNFSIKAKPGDTLVFYSVGFQNKRYLVLKTPEQVIKLAMVPQTVELKEVEITSRPSAEKINRALRNMKKPEEPSPTEAPPAPEPLWEVKETVPVKPSAYSNPATFLYDKYSKEGIERQKMEAIYQQQRDSAEQAKKADYDKLFLDRNKPYKEQYFYYRDK